jgi:hypothetical protein
MALLCQRGPIEVTRPGTLASVSVVCDVWESRILKTRDTEAEIRK